VPSSWIAKEDLSTMQSTPLLRTDSEGEVAKPPLVYVYEDPSWEYKHRAVKLGMDDLPDERELNELGGEGWELVGVLSLSDVAHFYFKRRRD
jgi:hypothetical protein